MRELVHLFLKYRSVFSPVLFVVFGGLLGGFMGATVLLILLLMFLKRNRIEVLFILLILTFFLADNFSFAQNFRFVMLIVSILTLQKYHLIQNNNANYLVLFTILATGITLVFSPVGTMAVLRSLAFWLVALVVFKFIKILYTNNAKRTVELILLLFTLYFGVTLLLVFLPFMNGYLAGRFKGLAGNPNGLALISMFVYAILEMLRKRKETSFSVFFFKIFKIVLFFIIILTGSRTALFSVVFFEVIPKLLHKKILLIPVLFILGGLYFLFSFMSLADIIEATGLSDFLRVESLGNASGRTDIWPVVWEEIKRNPWFGNGIMYDSFYLEDYVQKNIGGDAARQWGGVWSSYLSLLLDVGVIGCIAYAYFWKKMLTIAKDKKMAIAFVVMCLLSGITESWMAASMNAFTPMMFLFWAIQSHSITLKSNKF